MRQGWNCALRKLIHKKPPQQQIVNRSWPGVCSATQWNAQCKVKKACFCLSVLIYRKPPFTEEGTNRCWNIWLKMWLNADERLKLFHQFAFNQKSPFIQTGFPLNETWLILLPRSNLQNQAQCSNQQLRYALTKYWDSCFKLYSHSGHINNTDPKHVTNEIINLFNYKRNQVSGGKKTCNNKKKTIINFQLHKMSHDLFPFFQKLHEENPCYGGWVLTYYYHVSDYHSV